MKKELSPKASQVWNLLSAEQQEAIQKDYPLRADRNEEIRKLRARGVEFSILKELSGLSLGVLKKICKSNKKPDLQESNIIPETVSVLRRLAEILDNLAKDIQKSF